MHEAHGLYKEVTKGSIYGYYTMNSLRVELNSASNTLEDMYNTVVFKFCGIAELGRPEWSSHQNKWTKNLAIPSSMILEQSECL